MKAALALLLLTAAYCAAEPSQPLTLVSPSSLPTGTVGSFYSSGQYSGAGGFSPYMYSINSGSLPPGLSLDSSGSVSGTPTTAGTFPFTVRVTDYGQNTATSPPQSITITPALAISSPPLPMGALNFPYPGAQYVASGGQSPYSFFIASGSLPPGLTLNSTSGLIAGTPSAVGSFAFVVGLSDYSERTVRSPTQTIVINLQPLRIVAPPFPSGTINVPYPAIALGATGGIAPYTWAITAGALPQGLTLSSSGIISGTPLSAGLYGFTVTVIDSGRVLQSANASFQISINQPILVTPGSVPPGTVGVPYQPLQFSINLSGASPSFSIAGGALPPGLALSTAGVLSGTPTQAGSFTYVVAAAAQTGSGSAVITMTINNTPLVLPPITIPDIDPNTPVNIPLPSPTGGSPPYALSLTGCSIPGISLSAAGVFTGVATTPGTYSCTVSVTDSRAATASAPVTVKVLPILVITTTSVPAGSLVTSYPSTALGATGGIPPYTWSLAGGSLPPGLTLNSGGNLSGTPTAVGAFPFTVKVADSGGATATASLSITVTGGPQIAPAQLPDGTVNTPYPSFTFSATGGTRPYTFTGTGSVPPGLSVGSDGRLSGTPTQAGSFSFAVQVTDANQLSATGQYTIRIAPAPLTITTTSVPPATAFTPYSQTIAAAGGTGPYTFRVVSGSLPDGVSLAPNGVLSGTPSSQRSSTFTIQVTDSGQPPLTATQSFTVPVTLPTLSTPAIQNLPAQLDAAQQQSFGFGLQSAYPADIRGVLTLSFVSSAVVPSTDPALRFMNGDTKLGFTIPANRTDAVFDSLPMFSTGMVAGTITISASLTTSGTDITPTPSPTRTIIVNPAPPVVSSVTATNASGQLTVVIQGFSTTRQVTQAKFHFAPSGDSTLQTADLTVDVGSAFTQWYQSGPSVPFGSSFTYSQPFTLQGALAGTVTVTLVNDRGTSNAKSAQF